jgi:hypothetical protein
MPYGRLWQPLFGLLPGVKYCLPTYYLPQNTILQYLYCQETLRVVKNRVCVCVWEIGISKVLGL